MPVATTVTVGEIATRRPQAIRILEKHHIDYCCRGGRSFEDACQAQGLASAAILAEIEAAGAAPESDRDWNTAPLSDLATHIVERHHAYLRSELPALRPVLAKVWEVHGGRHGDSLGPLQRTFGALAEELTAHLWKEEAILFPLIRALEAAAAGAGGAPPAPGGSIQNPIRVMEHEHDSAGAALAELRRLTQDYTPPPDACPTYRSLLERLEAFETDLHRHIHLENNLLFPRAARLESRLRQA